MIDFERDFGVNAGYVQSLYEEWSRDPASVEESWRGLFERMRSRSEARTSDAGGGVKVLAPPRAAGGEAESTGELEALTGIGGRIVENMQQSLEVPTATSVRTIPAKLLDENRRILNEHLSVRAYAKASYTHLIAFALARALREMPRVQAAFEERDGKRFRRIPPHVNLGLAIDLASGDGRSLVVPCIREAESLSFADFHAAYEDLVHRARSGLLEAADFRNTTVTLTNPGGFGTTLSVPRLMKGQGLIVATGSIGVPPELAGLSPASLAELALGPVLTITSTYDHRVIQGAESGLLLKRVDELLQGGEDFYEEVFAAFRVPWVPHRPAADRRDVERADEGEVQTRVWELINAYRHRGCRLADLDPLAYEPGRDPTLDPSTYGFTVWDLDRTFLCGHMLGRQTMSLREILGTLRRAYCRRWTVESMHMSDKASKLWIREQVENPAHEFSFDAEHRSRILELLFRAENFERFLHATYVGNKRFSLEGGDTLIPVLAEILDRAAERGVERVVLGMAHRGRLNVLANIMGKSHEQIFGEFEGVLLPLSAEGTGDVKYHLGQRGVHRTRSGKEVEVILSANPSHLEAVDPVVCGMTRAYQDSMGDADRKRVLAILVHGDAAFSGQGVVTETLNMSALRAYTCGGTLHLIVNNQIGFTTGPIDLFSSEYCTDNAKIIQAPIFHANGDFPESALRAARVAVDYQREFNGDAVLDIVCYRRWGHNEGDEPAYTQPTLYAKIRSHPTVRESYTQLSIRRGSMTQEIAEEIGARFDAELAGALESFRAQVRPPPSRSEAIDETYDDPQDYVTEPSLVTGVPRERLIELVDALNAMPPGFVVHPNLLRQLHRREQMVRGERPVDWGCAEALALATLVSDGVSIRLAGQDSGRGTFSHRHAVVHHQATDEEHVPLAELARSLGKGTTFEVRDSLLSEEAALGFEYGYSLGRAQTLTIWEAQFGDFANGAQVPIDQFILSGQAKWRLDSSLVLLLPHGYDGQGPEHSSARPERFLAACSAGNAIVANCSTSAQYYHLLRRQGMSDRRRPLVLFTPKSLLREQRAASPIDDLAHGSFQELVPDERPISDATRRILLCTGKIYHELAARREERRIEDIALLRLEQLYPFPRQALLAELDRAPRADVMWIQEEPRNMGAWSFVLQRFQDLARPVRYLGRPESASPATGSYRRHQLEQEWILERAFRRS
jgi:2-oxoglutarate dehydrogenase E1 component